MDSEGESNDGSSVRTSASRTSFIMRPSDKVVCVPDDDSINIEFLYYTAMLKKFAPHLSKEKDKEKVVPWIRKLYGAEYATEFFKIKRNRYLFTMVLSILNDEMYGVFKISPPTGPLKSPESFAVPTMPLATWEVDNMWEEMLKDEDNPITTCTTHEKCQEEEAEEEVDTTNMSEEEKKQLAEDMKVK